jgi:hypothetical protein
MAANPEMPTPKPSFMYILSNSGALKNYPYLDFEDDRDGNQFKCIIHRQNKINELENTFSQI